MHIPDFFDELAIIFVVASILGLIFSKIKQPPIFAYILTGILVGPKVFGLIQNHEMVDQLAEIGVVALLFTLGLEFSFAKFKEIRNRIIVIGSLQIILTTAFVCLIMYFLDYNFTQSIFIGFAIALSSTVVVLRLLSSSAQIDSIHGRIIVGILIIQDISLIPIMIILPNLAAGHGEILLPLFYALIKAGIFLGLALFVSLGVTPLIMNFITNTNKEFLILSSIGIAIGTATLATYFGISIALGGFVAGLALSGTVQSKQVMAEVIPLRDVFAMVFFISIGMLLDTSYFFSHTLLILGVVLVIFLLKFIVAFFAVYLAKYPGQTALWAGLSLFQIGEFSFIISRLGHSQNLLTDDVYSLFITVTLITMLLTPFVVNKIPDIILQLRKIPAWNKYFKGPVDVGTSQCELKDHIIICGFGPIGRSIAKILTLSHQGDFIVLELNNKTIEELKSEGIQAIYGDATHEEILGHANIEKARIVSITLPDLKSCELAVMNARHLNKDVHVVVRARYQGHIDTLYNAGANVVVYEEYETSIGIIINVLQNLKYTDNEIETIVRLTQSNKFQIIQDLCREQTVCRGTVRSIKENEVEWIVVKDHFPFVNKKILDSNIRQDTGVSIISITRGDKNISNPSPDFEILEGDILAILGNQNQIQKLKDRLRVNS